MAWLLLIVVFTGFSFRPPPHAMGLYSVGRVQKVGPPKYESACQKGAFNKLNCSILVQFLLVQLILLIIIFAGGGFLIG